MPAYVIGVDMGGTKTAYGLFDEDHQVVARFEQPTLITGTCKEIAQAVLDGLYPLLQTRGLGLADLAGVGLAFPSYIDYERGHILCTTNVCNLKDFAARTFFEEQLGVRVVLDNDCNAAALAEHRLGAGRGTRHMLYCAVSTGIANGIIINHQLFRGSYGAAGETGHMIITPNAGVSCGCGHRGCFMSHTSGSMIVRHIQQWIEAGEKSIMLDMAGGDPAAIDGKILQWAAEVEDPLAMRAVEQMGMYLGLWTYNLYQAFNINCYVFGGGLVKMGGLLFDRIRAHFDRLNVSQAGLPVDFRFSELGRDVGIIGAEQLLYEQDAPLC